MKEQERKSAIGNYLRRASLGCRSSELKFNAETSCISMLWNIGAKWLLELLPGLHLPFDFTIHDEEKEIGGKP